MRFAVLLVPLLLISALPTLANAETCVNQGPVHACIDDPAVPDAFAIDGGSLTVNNGTASAAAQGGIVLAPGAPARIVVDYTAMDSDMSETHTVQAIAQLYQDGPMIATAQIDLLLPAQSAELVLNVPAGAIEPSVTGATLFIWISEHAWGNSGERVLATAQSSAPVLVGRTMDPVGFASAPPNVATLVTVATGNLSRSSADLSVIDSQLLIPLGTGVTLREEVNVAFDAVPDPMLWAQQDTTIVLEAWLPNGVYYSVSANPQSMSCASCTFPAGESLAVLEIAIPGDTQNPVGEVRVRAYTWSFGWGELEAGGWADFSAGAWDDGSFELVAPVG